MFLEHLPVKPYTGKRGWYLTLPSFPHTATVPSLALAVLPGLCLACAFFLSICLDSVLEPSMIVEMNFTVTAQLKNS